MTELSVSHNEKNLGMIQELHCLPEEQSSSQDNYKMIVGAIDAWDQIGDLTSEVSSSLMAKQAAMLCERFKEEELTATRPHKRRKLETQGTTRQAPGIVISDEDSSVDSARDSIGMSMSATLANQANRMENMSKLIMEMEYLHRQLRAEMLAVAAEDETCLY
jgi:hypothetical protein